MLRLVDEQFSMVVARAAREHGALAIKPRVGQRLKLGSAGRKKAFEAGLAWLM
jgi:hypothetical protein